MATPYLYPIPLLRRFLLPAALLLWVAQAHAGLVLHYKFDETSGTTAADSSGSGNTGTLFGADGSTSWVPGRIGNALTLESAASDYVRATGYKGVTGTNARTAALWFNTTSTFGYNTALHYGKKSGVLNDFAIWIQNNGKLYMAFGGGGVTVHDVYNDGLWHHVAITTEAGGAFTGVKVYLDGALAATGGGGNVFNTPAYNDLRVGRDGAGSYFEGLLDDVRLYDSALSASEVSALAAMGGAGVPEPAETFAFLGLLTAAGLGFREWCSRRKAKVA